MRIALITPWPNAWIPYFKRAIELRGHEFVCFQTSDKVDHADLVLHGWAAGKMLPGTRNVVFLRRYEYFSGDFGKVDWSQVERLICVNTWLAQQAKAALATTTHHIPVSVIYNGTDPLRWTPLRGDPPPTLGMACHVHPKKNLPLALQILARLPSNWNLHIAGAIQDPCTLHYINHTARRLRRKVYVYGHVEDMDSWWTQIGYCLSTSISEGNPNNVIEAMAKGIKPIVHAWPGADDQFPDHLFHTVDEAVALIEGSYYNRQSYRIAVEDKFSLRNYDRVLDLLQVAPVG